MLVGLVVGLIALTACGRIAFEATPIAADAPAPDDADPLGCTALPCSGGSAFRSCNGTCFATCDDVLALPDAMERCRQWGGTLAVIRDADEEACLQSLLTADVWLGYQQSATATQTTAGWTWADGSTSSYTNWRAAEPNDLDMVEDGEENCAIKFMSGTWNDMACELVFPAFACSF